jgi:hypothetical protein
MSRVAKMPVDLPQGVSATIGADAVTVKGAKGSLTLAIKNGIKVSSRTSILAVEASGDAEGLNAVAGATRAHLANMVTGVTKGYEKKLELVGVGYRAAVQAKNLNLTLGYSHLINFRFPTASRSRRRARPRSWSRESTASGRPDGGRNPRLPAARALQGQGREIFGREDFAERSEEEVAP